VWSLLLGDSTKLLFFKIAYVAFVVVLSAAVLACVAFSWWGIICWALGLKHPAPWLMSIAGFGAMLVFQFLRGVVGEGDLLCSILGIDRRRK
jgi:hypothetical protein